jgi:hypothetical protein
MRFTKNPMWEYVKNILRSDQPIEHHKKSTNHETAKGTVLSQRGSTLLWAHKIPQPIEGHCRDHR